MMEVKRHIGGKAESKLKRLLKEHDLRPGDLHTLATLVSGRDAITGAELGAHDSMRRPTHRHALLRIGRVISELMGVPFEPSSPSRDVLPKPPKNTGRPAPQRTAQWTRAEIEGLSQLFDPEDIDLRELAHVTGHTPHQCIHQLFAMGLINDAQHQHLLAEWLVGRPTGLATE